MKKVLTTITAIIVALSFSAVVFAADAPAAPAADVTAPAIEKKEAKPVKECGKKCKKAKKCKKRKKCNCKPDCQKSEKKEETPAAPAAK
jgi:hypothetical protein